MSEKTTPNSFSKGMITDVDPAYQSKESYYHGINVRVITNGDKSFSIENLEGPKMVDDPGNTGDNSSSYVTHGAAIVEDYLVTITKQNDGDPIWKINKYDIDELTADIGNKTQLWSGEDLFDDGAGKIEIEVIVETETIHRIYCTDGKSGLKSINIKDSYLSTKSASELTAFRPNLMKPIVLEQYNETGGNLTYGSYAYVYRLGSQGQGSWSDWSQVSETINIVKNPLASNTSLGVEGETSALNSSVSISLRVPNVTQDFQSIQVAAIHHTSENVRTINIVEEGSIVGDDHYFVHSGFETTTVVSGGIAAAIISNEKWDSCKSLAQKDNKLYASNLQSTLLNIDSTINGYGKLKSYKAIKNTDDEYILETHTTDENPHRHYNGSVDWSWDEDGEDDKKIYKFINKNFSTHQDPLEHPVYVLGAETDNFSTGSDGFRMTFRQESYIMDETFNKRPDGTFATTSSEHFADIDVDEVYTVDSSNNSSDYSGGKPGPHNPHWDHKYRSFKRGECYRFGIVFFDLQGAPGFAYHLGDIKMPDALDPNNKILGNFTLSGADAVDKPYQNENSCWSPFSEGSTSDDVVAHALIPHLEVRLPQAVLSVISGYRLVRAELTDDDKTIITQGIYDNCERSHSTYGNSTLINKIHGPGHSLHHTRVNSDDNDEAFPNEYRVPNKVGILHTPDVTFGMKNYELHSGYLFKPFMLLEANKPHNVNHAFNHKYFGYDTQSNMNTGGTGGTGFHVVKWKPWDLLINSAESANTKNNIKTPGGWYPYFRWTRELFLSKTVVNEEIVDAGIHQSDDDHYMHKCVAYTSGQTNTNDPGLLYLGQYGEASRGASSSDMPTGIMLATGPSGGVINLPGSVQLNGVNENTSISYYNNNNHRSNERVSGGYRYFYEGFKWLGEIIRDTTGGFEQYGGHSASAIENTRFYPCRDFKPTSTQYEYYLTDLTKGDVFCEWYTVKQTSRRDTSSCYLYGTIFPVESYVNISLRSGSYLGTESSVKVDTMDDFFYNSAYSQENNLKSYTVKPTGWSNNDTFKAKVAVSRTKILGELYDAWTQFPQNDFIDLNLSHGQITDLVNFRNNLYAVQDSGVTLLSVNSRALIQGEGAAADIQIVTGTGAAIERYDYLTTQFGSQHFNTCKVTPTGFYFLDVDKREIIKIDGQTATPLALNNNYKSRLFLGLAGDVPVVSSVANGLIGDIRRGIHTGYDPEFREVYFTVRTTSTVKSYILSDLTGALISDLTLVPDDEAANSSFLGIQPNIYFNFRNNLYAIEVGSDTLEKRYLMNAGGNYQKFSLGFVVNDNPGTKKIFDQVEIITDQETLFSGHYLTDSVGNQGSVTLERVRDKAHFVPLRSAAIDGRFRGNWLKYMLSYGDMTSKKFNIFAVVSKIRMSR